MDLDPLILSRAQFAFTVVFHFVFPAFSIGLASYLAVLEGLWLRTGNGVYANLYRYWLKIFAIGFGMGVVSGIVLSYEFGTNWSVFAQKTGPIIGPLMAYEVMTAFFLESGFLGVMLFGISKVGPKLHFFATCMVAVGTLISATWIISANSWMQTPVGFAINAKGQFVPAASWLTIVFNPSFPYRVVHTVLGAYLTVALVVSGVGAWHLLRDRSNVGARKMFSMAAGMLVIVAPLQILAGDQHGLNTLEHQPMKILAMEGDYNAHPQGAPLVLFGLPSNDQARVLYQVAVPKIGSLILKHDPSAALPGLMDFPRESWPPTPIIFWSFRVMVGLGFAMLGFGLWTLWARFKGSLYSSVWLHRAAVLLSPAGFIAVTAGWITTEVGRQPYTVYGHLLTAESRSPLAAPALAGSLAAFAVVYFSVFGSGIYYILRLMAKPPMPHEPEPPAGPQRAAGLTPAPRFEPEYAGGAVMMHSIDLTVVWALIIAFAIFGYVVMDGFDLGIGIMFPFLKVGRERDLAINAISPMWDGNETWLVLGGGGLMAVFPTAYAIILPATYPLIIAMLLGLIFRGVAFEFRWRDARHRPVWDVAFACGSIVAGFSQGVTLGAILQGIAVSGDAYAGGWLDWLSPFSILTGISVLIGYSLLGATWLVNKFEGEVQERARRRASFLAALFLIAVIAVSAATPFLHYDYWRRWFSMPRVLITAQVPILLVITAIGFFWSLRRGDDRLPFLLTLCFFGLTYVGLGISIFPYAVPQALTIWDAAAPEESQKFLLAGTVFIIPIIIGYTSWAYWVFRGKVPAEEYS